MANEQDVLAAWLKICRDDVGAGSLVTLVGRASPAVVSPDPEEQELPVIVLPEMPNSRVFGGAPYRRSQIWRPEVWVPRGSLKLAGQLLDRLEAVTTWAAFNTEGLDVQVQPGARSAEPPGDMDGFRLIADYRLTVTV